MSSSALSVIMFMVLGALGIFAFLYAAHEAAIRTVLQQGGVPQRARVVSTRRTYNGKSTAYYVSYAFEPHGDPYNRIIREQSVSWWLYREAKNNIRTEVQVKYLPGKPGINRITGSGNMAAMMVVVVLIGVVAAVILGNLQAANAIGRTMPNWVWAAIILAAVGWVVAYALMTSHYTQYISPEKPKGRPQPDFPVTAPAMDDDPFALVATPEKPKGTPAKPKRDSGFTPLDDDTDHPLV